MKKGYLQKENPQEIRNQLELYLITRRSRLNSRNTLRNYLNRYIVPTDTNTPRPEWLLPVETSGQVWVYLCVLYRFKFPYICLPQSIICIIDRSRREITRVLPHFDQKILDIVQRGHLHIGGQFVFRCDYFVNR